MFSPQNLTQLSIGEKAIVSSVEAHGVTRRRLLDLGLVPGTTVEAVRRSPVGDPTAFQIRGALIALRATEANLVTIQPS